MLGAQRRADVTRARSDVLREMQVYWEKVRRPTVVIPRRLYANPTNLLDNESTVPPSREITLWPFGDHGTVCESPSGYFGHRVLICPMMPAV